LFSGFYGIYEFRDDWSHTSFFSGYICGLPLITCFFGNKKIGSFLSIVGVISLLLLAFGVADHFERDRIFFIGLSLGGLSGWLPAYFLMQQRIAKFLAMAAHHEGYESLSVFFENKTRE
jgi:hypothetical protein